MKPEIQIPGYDIQRLLGKGGMAAVYLAVQKSFGREVAIKVLSPHHADEEFSKRFLREAQIVSRLMHPNIVTVYDVGIHEGYHYLSMEYIPGQDLKQAGRNLSKTRVVEIIKQVASALEYAAQKGYVHRDVKPDNIMLHADGRAILMDFGIARLSESQNSVTQTGKVVGTPHYMSPEQTKGMKVDHRSDIYSLGVVLYQLLSGYVPFDGETPVAVGIKHISEPIPLLPAGMEIFQPIINTCMSKDPDHRYQTAGQLIAALNGLDPKAIAAIDSKAAAFRQSGSNPAAQTIVTPAHPQATIQVVHPPLVHPGPRKQTRSDSVDSNVTPPPRRRRKLLFLLLLVTIAWAAYAEQARLQQWWNRYLAPPLQQLAVTLGLRSKTEIKPMPAQVSLPASPVAETTPLTETTTATDTAVTSNDTTTSEEPTAQPTDTESTVSSDVPGPSTEQTTQADAAEEVAATETVETTPATKTEPPPVPRATRLQQLRDELEAVPENGIELATLYREILQQTPTDQSARQDMRELQEWYRQRIQVSFDQQDLANARRLLTIMQQSFPRAAQHERFRKIEKRLQHAEAIQQHLHQANEYKQAQAYITPLDKNAVTEYNAVLALAPNHPEARQAITKLADTIYDQGNQLFNQGKLQEALELSNAAKLAFKNEPSFERLSQQIQSSIKQQHIATLLSKADTQHQAGNLITPQGESAFAHYQQVLKEAPDNSRAKTGLSQIEKQLVNDIDAAINNGNLEQAQQRLDSARQFFPASAALKASAQKLTQAMDALSPRITPP